MTTQRVKLLRDTLIKGQPYRAGSFIQVDPHMYNYLDNCRCIEDADDEEEDISTPFEKVAVKSIKATSKK